VRDNKADNNQTAKNRNVNAVSGKSKAINTARASRVAVNTAAANKRAVRVGASKADDETASFGTKRAAGVNLPRLLGRDKVVPNKIPSIFDLPKRQDDRGDTT
jgi:hypothetical protein